MKIGMLIYINNLDQKSVFRGKMIEYLLNSIQDSPRFHEIKLFFVHTHFDAFSIEQMNRLLDIYIEVLRHKNASSNPICCSFNVIKLSLLIYRICWKIEQKQIYSLTTKCTVLQDFLVASLSAFVSE